MYCMTIQQTPLMGNKAITQLLIIIKTTMQLKHIQTFKLDDIEKIILL